MTVDEEESSLARALAHPLRKKLVAALWHSSEPLTPAQIEDEYLDEAQSDRRAVVYHLQVLENAGVVRPAGISRASGSSRPSKPGGKVLGGKNAGEAVRRLGIADGRDP